MSIHLSESNGHRKQNVTIMEFQIIWKECQWTIRNYEVNRNARSVTFPDELNVHMQNKALKCSNSSNSPALPSKIHDFRFLTKVYVCTTTLSKSIWCFINYLVIAMNAPMVFFQIGQLTSWMYWNVSVQVCSVKSQKKISLIVKNIPRRIATNIVTAYRFDRFQNLKFSLHMQYGVGHRRVRLGPLLWLEVLYHQTRKHRHHHLRLHLDNVLRKCVDMRADLARHRYGVLGIVEFLLKWLSQEKNYSSTTTVSVYHYKIYRIATLLWSKYSRFLVKISNSKNIKWCHHI